jgi:hypothetical protein
VYNYYGKRGDYVWHWSNDTRYPQVQWFYPQLFRESDLVWQQGPKGGVRLVYQNFMAMTFEDTARRQGYITNNEKAMQEFMWIKLSAESLN